MTNEDGCAACVGALPNFALEASAALGASFVASGMPDYDGAAHYVHRLPYGRNSDRVNYGLVLQEGHGTCSTKRGLGFGRVWRVREGCIGAPSESDGS